MENGEGGSGRSSRNSREKSWSPASSDIANNNATQRVDNKQQVAGTSSSRGDQSTNKSTSGGENTVQMRNQRNNQASRQNGTIQVCVRDGIVLLCQTK